MSKMVSQLGSKKVAIDATAAASTAYPKRRGLDCHQYFASHQPCLPLSSVASMN